jgi:hypothetical protein
MAAIMRRIAAVRSAATSAESTRPIVAVTSADPSEATMLRTAVATNAGNSAKVGTALLD